MTTTETTSENGTVIMPSPESLSEMVAHALADDPRIVELVDTSTQGNEDAQRGPAALAGYLLELDNAGKIDVASFPVPGSTEEDVAGTNRLPDRYKVKNENNREVAHSWYRDTFFAFRPQYREMNERIGWLRKATNRKRDNSDLPKEYASIPYVRAAAELKRLTARINYAVDSLFIPACKFVMIRDQIMDLTNINVTLQQDDTGAVVAGANVLLERPGEAAEVKTLREFINYKPEIAAANGGTIAELKKSNAGQGGTAPKVGERIKTFDGFVNASLDLFGYVETLQESDDAMQMFRAALARYLGLNQRKKKKEADTEHDDAFTVLGEVSQFFYQEVWSAVQHRYNRLNRNAADPDAAAETAKAKAS